MAYTVSRSVRIVLLACGVAAMSGQAASSDPAKGKYVFFENTERWVSIIRGDWVHIGKLDKNGDFVAEFMWKKGQGKSLTPVVTLNSAALMSNPQKVYEFRSGMLIPGNLEREGSFVPEAGGKIIPFKDYEYSPTAIPIWNLPGIFITEEAAALLKKRKPRNK